MLFLISLALAVILLLILAPLLRKRPLPFYITGAVVSAAVTVLSQQHIENDVITSLTASTDEEETEYFDMAYGTMAQDIINRQSPDVDGVSGATYSSDDIKKALKKCLEKARR